MTLLPCPRCQRPTHPEEMIAVEGLWVCARCVEDRRVRQEVLAR